MRKKHALALAGLSLSLTLAAAAPAEAQQYPGLVASPPTRAPAVSSDYAKLVEDAYPVYDAVALAQRLSAAARALSARSDRVTVRSLSGVEQVLGLPPGGSTQPQGFVDGAAANYSVTPTRAAAQRKNPTYVGLEPARFAVVEPRVQQAEQAFLGVLGLPSDEVMKVSFRRVMMQSTIPGARDNSDGTSPLVRRGMTLAYRGFAGFPIEGSVARVSSFDGARVDGFSLRWPRFVAHSQVGAATLDAAANIKRDIVSQMTRMSQSGDLLSVTMGVVFRPAVDGGGRQVYIPAMKVVVTPQPKLQSLTGGKILTESGQVFYANILAAAPVIQPEGAQDDDTTP